METKNIKQLLQAYFNGESSREEDNILESYFKSGNVAKELREYACFFGGLSELKNQADDSGIEEEIMDFILENEHRDKTKFRQMWRVVTGVAASVIIVLGSFLIFQQQQKPFNDTFEDPEKAYAYAEQTLQYVSAKYNKGLAGLANFEKLAEAREPLQKGVAPINDFFENVEKIKE